MPCVGAPCTKDIHELERVHRFAARMATHNWNLFISTILLYQFMKGSLLGHSMSNQHAKWTPITDFAETW